MFRWIIGSSLKFRFLVIAAAAAMLAPGASQSHDMPVDVFPEFAPPLVEIQTEGIGMTTPEVEELITDSHGGGAQRHGRGRRRCGPRR